MIVSRRDHPQNTITIRDMSFQKVYDLKYLGIDINLQADSHEEIHSRFIAENKC